MERLLNIAFQGGTHGNFLRYFIEKFSQLTPELNELPFTDNGTSHKNIKFSKLIGRYHPFTKFPYFKDHDIPHIFITVEENDILFLQRIVNMRAGDLKIDVNQETILVSANYIEFYRLKDKFKELYNIDIKENTTIPKFIFRDFFKKSFLNPKKDGFVEINNCLLSNLPINCKLFPVNAFWDKKIFFENVKRISDQFDLQINLTKDAEQIYEMFIKNLKEYPTKDRYLEIINAIQTKQNINIENIDTVEQAYLSAWLEKNYKFILVPLTNYFFKTTKEILEWVEWYPEYYKAMNPNLPTFNGIPNPYYLHGVKK